MKGQSLWPGSREKKYWIKDVQWVRTQLIWAGRGIKGDHLVQIADWMKQICLEARTPLGTLDWL